VSDVGVVRNDQPYYQQMIESITEYGVIRLDGAGIVRSWHAGAERMFGYADAEIVGQSALAFYSAEEVTAGRMRVELNTVLEHGRYEAEAWRVRRGGDRFWASWTITPIRGDAEADGFVIVTRDLTDRLAQEVALRSIEQMIDGITDYEVIRLDPDGTIRSWNPGAERLRQYRADEVVGRHISMFYSAEDIRRGLPERQLAVAARDGRLESDGWRERKDGSRFWSSSVLSPIRDVTGELVGYVRVARDMTERREHEQLVQRQRDEILELSTPVIEVWQKVLVLPIIGTLDSSRAARLTESLLDKIAANQSEVVILDVSGVPAIDTDVAQHLLKTVEAARLMGTVSVLSGVRPETAQAIVHLGIDLGALRSRASLSDALQLALKMVGADAGGPGRPVHAGAAGHAVHAGGAGVDRIHADA
jgi:rsbT co-antagonist protein RsbR